LIIDDNGCHFSKKGVRSSDVLHGHLVEIVLAGIEELLVHLKQRNKGHRGILRNNKAGDAPLLIRNLFSDSGEMVIVTCVTDSYVEKELEEIFEEHPESTIIGCSESASTRLRFSILIFSDSQLLMDVRVFVPSM
jgi:hypothetical protein